jgi:hypothetical protein
MFTVVKFYTVGIYSVSHFWPTLIFVVRGTSKPNEDHDSYSCPQVLD